jgi:hypothetical protein
MSDDAQSFATIQSLTSDGSGQAESDLSDGYQNDAEKRSVDHGNFQATDDVQAFAKPQSTSLGGTGWAEHGALDGYPDEA